MLEFNVIIEKDEDGWFVASVPEISGCYTQGKTVEQAIERIKEAIEVCLESEKEHIAPLKFIGLQRVEVSQHEQIIEKTDKDTTFVSIFSNG